MLVGGIDEVRRGPVIGDMVMALTVCDDSQFDVLKKIGVRDSKKLSAKKREQLYPMIHRVCEVFIKIIPPSEIDAASRNAKGRRLNYLEAVKAAQLIGLTKAERVILDCPETIPETYIRNIRDNFGLNPPTIDAYHHADSNWVIVGAASVVAKVEGDRRIAQLKKELGVDFGSGYPSDSRTREFVRTLIKSGAPLPEYIRQSWKTLEKLRCEPLSTFI